jgi:hypothetical protein
MKSVKLFFNGKRLKDVYVGASKWQVFKYKIRKLFRKLIIGSVSLGVIYCSILIGAEFYPKTVYTASEVQTVEVDNLSGKIAQIKAEAVEGIKKCESAGHSEDDGIIIFDSNNVPSIGQFQYQRKTVQHYYNVLYGKKITAKEAAMIALDTEKATELTSDIIFKTKGGGLNDWVICSQRTGLANTIAIVKKLETK